MFTAKGKISKTGSPSPDSSCARSPVLQSYICAWSEIGKRGVARGVTRGVSSGLARGVTRALARGVVRE